MMLFGYKERIDQWKWFEAEELNSTNDAIKKLQESDFPAVISALRQTKGRGRRGRKWIGIEGNLYFTYSLKILPQELSQYVCLIGLSLVKTVKRFSPNTKVEIKWPNDIFMENKKLTGVLLEHIRDDNWAIGIGVNIAKAPIITDQPYEATSLKENWIETDRITFLKKYLIQFSQDLETYKREGFTNIKAEWLKYAYRLGEEIVIKNEKSEKRGIFLTLDDNGYLVLKTKEGEEKIIAGDLFS